MANNVSPTKADLIKENEELRTQIEELKTLVLESVGKTNDVSAEITSVSPVEKNDTIDVNEFITVTSITTGGVNIRAGSDGNAKTFRFEKIGQTLPIMYGDLANAINSQRDFFEEGLLYINNPKVVKNNYLEEFYNKFLTYDKITNILDFDTKTISNMIENTLPAIKETIALLIANKINNGDVIDLNKVEAVSKSSEIDIRDLANKIR